MRLIQLISFAAIAVSLIGLYRPALAGTLPDNGLVDYQLGGGYPPSLNVTIVVRDSTDQPVPGLFNICYINGFQTQPGVAWPEELLVRGLDGKPMVDPGWPDEFLLDISTEKSRRRNLALIKRYIDVCAEKGFDAIEFDNLDSYTRSRGHINQADALSFAKLLVDSARERGLPSGQKNAGALGRMGRDEAGFSFAVAEECDRWRECETYSNIYGIGQVIDIEYVDNLRNDFTTACAEPNRPEKMILRDKMLVPVGSAGYVLEICE
ncbi:endo alpha-1,4 polygalactosaminidase [Rhizobium sp. CNPSo 3968]|uniref:endo alpha-1,4 polygalactosaminidase n=1 Tax=Rhizobium sp. CNPSo 3968 TaxID=3021408 RepID=UPI00254DC547|nr:endo alpha-1,4 polygalactosaminidase [Rhizobium sp. CNPSo 3968]MDK4717916.1 endo alpha-1,4 polygalactosaminidase [Rhizobium sp. CNPSo 3968]